MAKKSAKSKGFRRQNAKKPYLSKRDIAVLCAVVALVAIGAFFLFRYDDGALKVQDGKLTENGEDWLVVNGSNTRGGKRYYKLGEVGQIDGYTREKTATASDANLADFNFKAEDAADISIGCSHNPAKAMADYTRSSMESLGGNELGEVQAIEVGGQTAYCYVCASKPAEGGDAATDAEVAADGETAADAETAADGETAEATADSADAARYSRSLAAYIDAPRDSCVIVHVNSKADTAEGCASDEALNALLEQAVAAVTLEAAK